MFLFEMAIFFCRSHFPSIGDTIGLSIIAMSTALLPQEVPEGDETPPEGAIVLPQVEPPE